MYLCLYLKPKAGIWNHWWQRWWKSSRRKEYRVDGDLSVVRMPQLHVSSDIHLGGEIKSEALTRLILSTNLGWVVIGYGMRAVAVDVLLARLWVNCLATWPQVGIKSSGHVVVFSLVNWKIRSSRAHYETLLIISPLLRSWLSLVIVLPKGKVVQTSSCLY